MVHPVQRGSMSACGCQILHRIDICYCVSCATRWLQHNATIFNVEEVIFSPKDVSPEELRVTLVNSTTLMKEVLVFIKTHNEINHKLLFTMAKHNSCRQQVSRLLL